MAYSYKHNQLRNADNGNTLGGVYEYDKCKGAYASQKAEDVRRKKKQIEKSF